MKNTLIIIFLVFSTITSATDYYISSSGNDVNNNGLSPSTPWKTITKVNSAFSIMKPGDRILFNRGDTFYGTITVTKSGSAGSPIVIGAYGSGVNPIITGFTTITGWTNEGGGIYSNIITSEAQTNMVTIDGVNTGMGRYPNSTYLTYESFSTNVSITDNQLNVSPDWAGAEVVIRKNDWELDRCIIMDHTGDKLTYAGIGGAVSPGTANYGYFIQNDLRCVTDYGEWYHNTGTGKFFMYFGTVDPTTKIVKVATINNLVYNSGYDYITIDNLSFTGCIDIELQFLYNNDYCTIQNCSITFAGQDGIRNAGSYGTISSNYVSDCGRSGIGNYNTGSTTVIINNIIKNIGIIKGQYKLISGLWSKVAGIAIEKNNCLVQNNTIENVGYVGIFITSSVSIVEVKNNFINNTCLILDDGGGIYLIGPGSSRLLEGNIVLNSFGNTNGTNHSYTLAEGIYLDESASNVTVRNNTVANCSNSGIKLHKSHDNTIENNTSFNNYTGINFENWTGSSTVYNNTLTGNIFFAKASTQFALRIASAINDISSFGTSDNNYYARPIDDDDVFYTNQPSTGSKNRTLAEWQSFTNQDANSHKSLFALTNNNDIKFEYNASKTNKVITLDQPMIDVKGTKYINSITLLPFTSVVLMVDPIPTQSVIPVYSGSAIENSTPSILEITYNVSLASTIPASNAFTVQINGVNRNVSSVAISGTKVLLSLSSAVVYGDVVTISYTKPSTNPLQIASGGQAASVSAQTVTNKVTPSNPLYVSSAIENATPAVLEMTYNLGLANIVSAASTFTVMVNAVVISVNSVTISGTKVILTLASAVVYGDIVTVAYTKPSINPLQTTSGGQAASINAQTVTNKVTTPNLVYVSSAIENAAPAVLELTYNQNLANIVPAASTFTVLVNSVAGTVNSAGISGTKVLLTLAIGVVYGDVVTVAYTKPSTNLLQTTSGGQASSISAQTVTNNVTFSSPVYINSSIENATPTLLEMTYNLSLANIAPAASAFTVRVNSVAGTVNSVAVSGTKVMLTLASAVVYGDVVTVAYSKSSINPLQTTSGGQAASISAQTVTNKVTPPSPVYVSSAIENATPSVLEMTYNLSLANIVPATSAFTVRVNSVAGTVNSVAISGTKVMLTLASAVVYGDVVTVVYSKPSANPLQTTSGGQAAAISAQTVTNNCLETARQNDPPILVIKNETSSYSGFVGEIDASGSYDLNNDILTYEWIVPDNVSVSSTSSPKIQFLAPVVNTAQVIEFQLRVNDGKAIVSRSIPINVKPYKPGLTVAKIENIEASSYNTPDYPNNVVDGNVATKWSVDGDNQWLLFKVAEPFKISHLELAFLPGQKNSSYFDIFASEDNLIWEPVLTKVASCNFSGDRQVFDFPASKNNTEYSYIKLVGHGNSLNTLNSISEFKIFGFQQQNPGSGDTEKMKILIYPNPAQDFFNISIKEPALEPDIIRIIDFSGRIVFKDSLEPGIKNIQIQNNLNKGVYIVELRSGSLVLYAQKLIINK